MYDRDIKGRGNRYLNVFPSSKVMSREHECLREMNGVRLCFKPLLVILKEINRHLIGWNNCFRFGYPRKAFRQINSFARSRLAVHLRRRSQRHFPPPEGQTIIYEHLGQMGLVDVGRFVPRNSLPVLQPRAFGRADIVKTGRPFRRGGNRPP